MDWIKPNTEIKFNLLYQISRDGDRITNFFSKVSNKNPTLVLVKSAIGNKFGGFTNEKWENNSTYKKDENAFLFSINKKKNIVLIIRIVQFIVLLIILLLGMDMIYVFMINVKLLMIIIIVISLSGIMVMKKPD